MAFGINDEDARGPYNLSGFQDDVNTVNDIYNSDEIERREADEIARAFETQDIQAKNFGGRGDAWRQSMKKMRDAEISKRNALLDQEIAEFDGLVMKANQQRAIMAHQRDVAFLSLFKNAAQSPYGASDPALNDACGASFGIPGLSGMKMVNDGPAAGNFAIYQAVRNGNGSIGNKPVMLIDPFIMAQVARRLRVNGYSNRDVQALSDAAWNLGKKKLNLTDAQMSERGFQNPNGPIVVGGTTDGKATARLMGRTGDNRSTVSTYSTRDGGVERVYNGHTGEDTGYVHLDPVRAAREMAGRWKQTGIGPASNDPNDTTQVRTYENTATGEVVRVKDGETPPWQRGSISERERIAKMKEDEHAKRAEADRLSKEKRAQAYADERKALREQNRILSEMRMLGTQRDKELDPKKKEDIQKKIDELAKGLHDVPDPDAADQNSATATPSTAGSATGAVVDRNKGQVKGTPSNVVASPSAGTDPEAARRAANGAAMRKRKAEGKQVDGNVKTDKEQAFSEYYESERKKHGLEDMPESVARERFEDEWNKRRRKEAIMAMTPDEEKEFGGGGKDEQDAIVKKVLARIDGL